LTQSLIFRRDNQNIIAKIISVNIEPLDTGNGKQVVFFCQDANGRRYRVPKSEVLILGKQSKLKEKKTKKKARKIA
jgi:hypothetical protein